MGVEVGSPLVRQPAHPPSRDQTLPLTALFMCLNQLGIPPQYSGVDPSGQEPEFLYSVWDEWPPRSVSPPGGVNPAGVSVPTLMLVCLLS